MCKAAGPQTRAAHAVAQGALGREVAHALHAGAEDAILGEEVLVLPELGRQVRDEIAHTVAEVDGQVVAQATDAEVVV